MVNKYVKFIFVNLLCGKQTISVRQHRNKISIQLITMSFQWEAAKRPWSISKGIGTVVGSAACKFTETF